MRSASRDVDLVRRVRWSRCPTGFPREQLERLSEDVVVEHFRAGAKVSHAVDLRGMTNQAIDRPHERLVRRPARRHPERHHPWVVAPQDQADLVANNRVYIPHDGLRDQVPLEQRLRNPRGAVVGLIHEVEQRPLAIPLRSRIGLAPAIHDVTHVGIERGRERFVRQPRQVCRLGPRQQAHAGPHEHGREHDGGRPLTGEHWSPPQVADRRFSAASPLRRMNLNRGSALPTRTASR